MNFVSLRYRSKTVHFAYNTEVRQCTRIQNFEGPETTQLIYIAQNKNTAMLTKVLVRFEFLFILVIQNVNFTWKVLNLISL